jgi:hypothetical protein
MVLPPRIRWFPYYLTWMLLFLPYDLNDHKNSIRDFIYHTLSNRMWLWRLNTPQHYGVPCDVICGTLLTSLPMICQPYNSNLYFLDLYRRNLIFLLSLFFYFTSNLFDQIKTLQTNIWSSGYIHIYSNHLWSLRNKDFHYTLITSLIYIHPYAWFSISYMPAFLKTVLSWKCQKIKIQGLGGPSEWNFFIDYNIDMN